MSKSNTLGPHFYTPQSVKIDFLNASSGSKRAVTEFGALFVFLDDRGTTLRANTVAHNHL